MTRVLSGVLLAAAFLAVVWFSNATVLLGVALGVCALAYFEYEKLFARIGVAIPRLAALPATLVALASVPFPYVAGEAVVGVGLAVVAAAAMARRSVWIASDAGGTGLAGSVHAAAAGALSIVYLGLPLGALVGIHVFGGRGAVLLLVGAMAVSDTAQYYAGRLFGRRALSPRISPKKTVEGALGGFVAAPLFLYFAGPVLVPIANPLTMAALGLALVAAGIAGDLFESLIKRAAGSKDSSTLIPGHGGMLDRIDALLFASPVFYMYLRSIFTV